MSWMQNKITQLKESGMKKLDEVLKKMDITASLLAGLLIELRAMHYSDEEEKNNGLLCNE
jgi:hypothetical protein